jgi:hypothetical protein
MAKEKSKGDEFSAIGRQTTARAYSAMDYYFDHLKETIASAPSGGMEFGEKVKASAEQNISATQELCEGADLRQGHPGYTANSDGIRAVAIGGVWRAGKRPRRGVYQSGIWSNHEATPGTVMHEPLLST